jgi:hypothetical protein
MNLFPSLLSWLSDGYWPSSDANEAPYVPTPDVGPRYTPLHLLACGDAADLVTAAGQSPDDAEALYLLKVAHDPEGNAHLEAERKALAALLGVAGHTSYRAYLPALVESCATSGGPVRRINVFRWEPGFYTIEQVHEQHPALDGRHLAWIFKRLLTVLGFCHRQGIIHGAVLPCHALIHPAGHGLRLVGWGGSVAVGRRIRRVPARYRDWYPPEVHHKRAATGATDLFLAARCLVYLAGDPVAGGMPPTVPPPMQRFLQTCLLESPSMRPGDAWDLMEDFDELLHALYGPPKFHPLTLT